MGPKRWVIIVAEGAKPFGVWAVEIDGLDAQSVGNLWQIQLLGDPLDHLLSFVTHGFGIRSVAPLLGNVRLHFRM